MTTSTTETLETLARISREALRGSGPLETVRDRLHAVEDDLEARGLRWSSPYREALRETREAYLKAREEAGDPGPLDGDLDRYEALGLLLPGRGE